MTEQDKQVSKPEPARTGQKIIDVVHPKDMTPSTTSRPVVIANRPMVAADPMIAAEAEKAASEDKASPSTLLSAPVVSRQARKLEPPSHDGDEATATGKVKVVENMIAENAVEEAMAPPLDSALQPEASNTEEKQEESPESKEVAPVKLEDAQNEKVVKTDSNDEKNSENIAQDADSTSSKMTVEEDEELDADVEKAKQTKSTEQMRQEELEAQIAKATYAVPINRVARKRTAITGVLLLITILLIALLDLLLDMGLLKLSSIPHTQFFH